MGLSRLRRIVLVLLAVVVGGLALSARWITDLWWFEELGYGAVFWTRVLAPWAVGLAAALILGLFFTVNIRYAVQAWYPVLFRIALRFPWAVPERLQRLASVAGFVLGLLFARVVASQWEIVARYVHRVPFGRVDPLFGLDLGFYFFTLPFYRLIHLTAAGALLIALIGCALMYAAARAVNWSERGLYMDPRPRRHLFYLGAGLLILKAIDYRLQQLELVYSTRGVVFGAGYTDTHVVLPLMWVMMVLCVGAAFVLVRGARTGLGRPALLLGVLLGASVLLLEVLPGIVQKSLVEPNEIVREAPYITRGITLTRFGYDLDRIEEQEFHLRDDLDAEKLAAHDGTIHNVRLWDWRPMHSTFRQLQEIRFYYRFPDVDVARYRVEGRLRQVMTAVRELDVTQINNRTWINEHLQYTHGYGLVMSPVNETTPEGLPVFWIQDIPPRSVPQAPRVERPEIYFGELTNGYALVGTRIPEFDYPMGDDNAWTRYEGRGGIPVNNMVRRFLFAVRTGDAALVLSNNLTEETRILMRRQVAERVRTVAPFLRYDRDPYAVVADGRIFWIVDAYTTSAALPYSQPVRGWGNYVRNAVKVVVDAYNGDVTFYAFDPDEPLLQVYRAVYPTLFTPLEEMPPSLREHIRYPEDLFLLQARMYSVYHMSNPSIFYNQEDVWHVAREIYRGQEQEMSPYYTILQLPGATEPEMVLMLPLTPARRNNMIAWLAARNDGEHYGRLIVYRFPKDQLVFGPMQVEARIDQDPSISEALTLWDQAGSQVLRGNMLVLPLEGNLLYVKPIFLRAETGELPELVRVIVAYGPRLVMTRTLEEALTELFGPRGTGVRPPAGARDREVPGRPDTDGVVLGPDGTPADGDAMRRLAARALQAWETAQDALRRGDWSGYGAALEELEAILRQMAP